MLLFCVSHCASAETCIVLTARFLVQPVEVQCPYAPLKALVLRPRSLDRRRAKGRPEHLIRSAMASNECLTCKQLKFRLVHHDNVQVKEKQLPLFVSAAAV